MQLVMRNRLEFRWREKVQPYPDLRFRHRAMLVIPLKNVYPLKSFSCFNELFYDLDKNYFSQDRLCPCQLNFIVSDTVSLDVFLIMRLFYENMSLKKSLILGTQLNF